VETQRRVTITDVARVAGVSIATVSKVINDRYGVAQPTADRVREVIHDLGYESSLVARSLRSHRTGLIGILVAEFEPFSTELLKGVSAAARDSGYQLLAYSGGGSPESQVGWERRSLSQLSGTLIDGAILVTPTIVDGGYRIPVVAIDPHTGPTDLPTVESDNLAGAQAAVQHLIDLGHRRIGFLGGRPDLESARLREEGFRRTMAAAGLPVEPALLRSGGFRMETSDAPARDLLAHPDRPTAVFAANDLMAIQVMHVAQSSGLRIPDDLSVIGFDNIPEAAAATPGLTTIAQPLQSIGQTAMQLLLALLRGEEPRARHVQLATELVVRESTAPPSR